MLDGEGGSDALRFTGAGAGSISLASIANFETAQKTGAGTWTLTGTNAAPAPAFDVQQGRLAVDGTAAGLAVTVQSGASVGGTGSPRLQRALRRHHRPRQFDRHADGRDANFAAGSVLENELDPATTDLLNVTGTATIAPARACM